MLEELVRWVPALEPVTSAVAVPLWGIVAAATALVGLLCLFVFTRSARKGSIGVVARLLLIAIVAGATWIGRDLFGSDNAAERRALDARIAELAARAFTPGSALACLDATAGETVESSCEKAVFATPEATAAAASYVAAQLMLLADVSDYARHSGSDLPALANLRHAVELDRFGLAARVLAVRDGCTAQKCRALALLGNPGRVKANLDAGTYDLYVIRHLAGWPPVPGSPGAANLAASPASASPEVARAAPEQPGTAGASAAAGSPARMPLAKLFFPSSESIPAINIMNAEPNAPANAEQSKTQPSGAATPTPPRKPVASSTPPSHPAPPARQASPQQRPPVDLNAAPQSGSGAPVTP
jgi:hypothetical protein